MKRCFLFICALSLAQALEAADLSSRLLPRTTTVYVKNGVVSNEVRPGFQLATIQNITLYRKTPGCYIACYTHAMMGGYSVAPGVQVAGQVRVPGKYVKKICVPNGFAGKNLSQASALASVCNNSLTICANTKTGCWAGGDTGGFF